MTHANAPLTPTGPLRMVHRHLYDGVPQAHVAAKFRVFPAHCGHLGVKKLGRIPDGGGWWAHGRGSRQALASERAHKQRGGYTYLPSAVDGFSRLAYTEALEDEKATTGNGANYAGVGLHPHRGSTGQQALTDPPLHATAQSQSRTL